MERIVIDVGCILLIKRTCGVCEGKKIKEKTEIFRDRKTLEHKETTKFSASLMRLLSRERKNSKRPFGSFCSLLELSTVFVCSCH